MANEFKVKKGLIVNGSGSTVLDIQGSQGQLFSVTDQLSGSLFSVNDISGIPILEVFSDDRVNIGTFGAEAIKVSGSYASITGSLFGTSSYAHIAGNVPTISGTTNYITKFTGTSTLGNSLIYDDGTYIGIGTTNPRKKLSIENGGFSMFADGGTSADTFSVVTHNYVFSDENEDAVYSYANSEHEFSTQGNPRVNIDSVGLVGIGTTSPSEKLEVSGNIKLSETAATTDTDKFAVLDNGVIKYRTGTEVLSDIGAQVSLTNPITGTGTTNYIPKFTGTSALGNSLIYDDGTNVGIGTTSPGDKLSVVGNVSVTAGNGYKMYNAAGNAWGQMTFNETDNRIQFNRGIQNSGADFLLHENGDSYLNANQGNVGIGTTSPSQKLSIIGKIALNDGGNSVFIGDGAGVNDDASDNRNVGVGYRALYSNTTGAFNTANGYQALYSNTTGGFNTANGPQALYSNTTGAFNTAYGPQALYSNTTGVFNTANGTYALHSNTTGVFNTANGYQAGRYIANGSTANTTGNFNVFLGANTKALADNDQNEIVIGYNTTGLGSNTVTLGNDLITTTALKGNVGIGTTSPSTALDVVGKITLNDGGNSVFIGTDAGLNDDTSDNSNVGVGYQALRSNTTGFYNTANGSYALHYNTEGFYNTANGYQALSNNTTGYNNTANGYQSLFTNSTGAFNTATGVGALYNNTTSYNTSTGYQSMYYNTSGLFNTANGFRSLYRNSVGKNNVTSGMESLYSNTSGSYNSTYGFHALFNNTIGNNNVAMGYQAGRYIADKSTAATIVNNSVLLGYRTSPLADDQTNQIVIGYDANGLGSNTVTLGNDSITTTALKGNVGIGTTSPNSKLHVKEGDITIEGLNTSQYLRFIEPDGSFQGAYVNYDGSSNILKIGVHDANDTNTANDTDAISIPRNSGNVGIGTTSPSQKLDVVGKIALNDGGSSVYIGTDAGLNDDASDNRNVGVGYRALCSNTSGSYNTANGSYTLYLNTSGSYNTANGYQALRSNTTGNYNTANGPYALYSNTSGSYNTANGSQALRSNTTGYNNTANGYQALYSNTTGYNNTANGSYTLYLNTTGNYNTANGPYALCSNTSGSYNTANGSYTLYLNTTGNYNTANGPYALFSNTSGSYNTANGYEAGRYIADGSTANTTGNFNVFLGAGTKALADNDQNEIVIGYNTTGLGSNTVTLGNDLITTTALKGKVGIGTTSPTRKLDVLGGATFGTSQGAVEIGNSGTIGYVGGHNGLVFSTDHLNVGIISGEKVRITSAGNVGIGTTSPSQKLQVAGTVLATGYRSADNSPGITQTITFVDHDSFILTLTFKNGLLTGYSKV